MSELNWSFKSKVLISSLMLFMGYIASLRYNVTVMEGKQPRSRKTGGEKRRSNWTETKPLQINGLPCCLVMSDPSDYKTWTVGRENRRRITWSKTRGERETFIIIQKHLGN